MTSYPESSKLSRMNEGRHRLDLVVRLLDRKENETVEEIALEAGMSRQWLYQLAGVATAALAPRRPGPEAGWKDVARLEAENAALRAENATLEAALAERDARLACSVEVTPRRVAALELVCFAANATLRGTQEVIEAAYGPAWRPPLPGLQARMKAHGQTARALLDQARGQVRDRITCVMADDVYFHRADIKVVAEPDSMAVLNLGHWEGSSGLDWVVWLEEFAHLDLVVSDLGKDLVGAVSQLGLPHAADFFHEMRWFDRKLLEPLSAFEASCRTAWLDALDRATRVAGPGRRLSPAKVEAAHQQAERAEAAFFQAMTAVDRLRELYEPRHPRTGRLWSAAEAEAALSEIIATLAALEHSAGRKAARHVREHRRRYYAHLAAIDAIPVPLAEGASLHPRTVLNGILRLGDLRRGLEDPTAWTDYRDWLDRRRLADALEERLRTACPALDAVTRRLRAELRRPKRSSSGIESYNSRLRVLQMVHRNTSDDMLALITLSWNLKPRTATDPRGRACPYDALGVDLGQQDKSWYDVLLDAENQHRAAA